MANEIYCTYYSGNLIDAYVFKAADDKVFDQSHGGDAFETWNDLNVLNYDIPMTDQGDGHYTVDFPAVITNNIQQAYRIVIKLRVGANAAVGDTKLADGEIYWDGSMEINIGTINITNQTVTNIYEEDISSPPATVLV